MLYIYNTATQKKEPFKSIKPGKIGIYVCGMTVYDYCHIGHARVLVTFDVITRYLRNSGYEVTYVRNITDIDDKIINRAHENNEPFTALTKRFITAMHEDCRALNILPPNHEPPATMHIDAMIKIIQKLLVNGYAYQADNGDIYYDVNRFATYGKLAHRDLEKLRAGARVAVVDAKHDPLDFVLWKAAKSGEPSWESPWGYGRPGWHIECSAMSMECLGEHFDIHGGGFDLTFPHHENEIAQSEAATGKTFVNTWMHVGFVQINQEKMSKSLGNFLTIRDVLAEHEPEVVRYFLLASHYRSPLNYATDPLVNAKNSLERFYLTLRDIPPGDEVAKNTEYERRFNEAMDDDFNTPEALAVLFDLAREVNRLKVEHSSLLILHANLLRQLGNVFGILQQDPEMFLQGGNIDAKQIESLISQRNQARADKQWAEADRLRDQLAAMGVAIEDSAQGTTWRKL